MGMFIANSFSGKSAENFQLDAGMLVTGLDMKNFDGNINSLSETQKIGATTGGGSVEIKPEMRDLFEDVDGARFKYKQGMVTDRFDITLKMTLLEFKEGNLQLALGASEKNAGSFANANYDSYTPKVELTDADFKTIFWLGTLKGSDKPMVIEIKNAMNTEGFNLSFEDKGKGKLELNLEALGDLAKPTEIPVTIYIPKNA